MAKLGIIKNFNASHGSDKHEHNFKVEVVLQGNIKDSMVNGIDFHDARNIVEEELKQLEGKYLNDYLNIKATVENIAIYLLKQLQKRKISNLYLIKIFEEADRYVKYMLKKLIRKRRIQKDENN